MPFDAVDIEHAFARLIGESLGGRGTSYDADVFRSGRPSNPAKALSEAIDAIESKANTINFSEPDSIPGGSKARLDVAIVRLRAVAQSISQSKISEPNDYHWEIISHFISIITSLFEKSTLSNQPTDH